MKRIYFLSTIFFGIVGSFCSQSRVDSILNLIKQSKNDTSTLKLFVDLTSIPSEKKCVAYGDQGVTFGNVILKKSENDFVRKRIIYLQSKLYENMGVCNERFSDVNQALVNYEKSLDLANQIGDKEGMGVLLSNMGIIYTNQGNIKKASENYNLCLKIFEDMKYSYGIANIYNNIGYLNVQIGEDVKGLEYYEKALKIWETTKSKEDIAIVLNNIAQIYTNREEYKKALNYFSRSLKIQMELNDKRGLSYCFNNMAIVYDHTGDYEKAIDYYKKGLELRKEINDVRGLSNSYYNLGAIYEKLNNMTKAKEYGLLSMKYANEIGFPIRINKAASLLVNVYKKEGKYKEALEMRDLAILMRDSMLNMENRKTAFKQQVNHEYEIKAAEDSVRQAVQLKLEETRHEHEIAKQRTLTYSGIFGFLLMLIIAGVSFNAFRQKKKANTIISEQKHLVEVKQKEIIDSINYARRIQQSLMPTSKYISKKLDDLKK